MKYKTYSPTESEMRTELVSLRRQLAEASNEISCCDDVPLQDGLAAAIGYLREQRDAAEAKLALAEQDGKRLDYMLHWHATTLTDGNGWRVAFEYTSPATYATVKKYQTQREAIDAAIAAGEGSREH